jgi:hypothetical protein
MISYLEEVHKLEKRFLGMGLEHIPHNENQEADDITKRASRREPQLLGMFEERLFQPSVTPQAYDDAALGEQLPPAPNTGAPDCSLPSRDRLLLTLVP